MQFFSAQPSEKPKRKSKFQLLLLFGLICVLSVLVILDVLSFTGIFDLGLDKKQADNSEPQTKTTNIKDSKKPQVPKKTTWDNCETFKTEKEYLPKVFGSLTADTIEKYEPKGWLGKYFGSSSESGSVEEFLSEGVSVIIRKDNDSKKYIKEAFQLDDSKLNKNLHGAPAFVGVITVNHNNSNVRLTPEGFTHIVSVVEKHQLVVEMLVKDQPEEIYSLWFKSVCKKV